MDTPIFDRLATEVGHPFADRVSWRSLRLRVAVSYALDMLGGNRLAHSADRVEMTDLFILRCFAKELWPHTDTMMQLLATWHELRVRVRYLAPALRSMTPVQYRRYLPDMYYTPPLRDPRRIIDLGVV